MHIGTYTPSLTPVAHPQVDHPGNPTTPGDSYTRVYLRCPGMVMRCPNCANTEIVLVEINHNIKLTVGGLATIDLRETGAP